MFVCVCVCVKTIFANYHKFSRKINLFREKDDIARMFRKDDFRELPQISRKINNFREKDEITRMFVCVCVKRRFSRITTNFREK